MIKDRRKLLVECKHYDPDSRVGRPVLQKLFAAMTEEEADGGIFVTNGGFAKTAFEYANGQLVHPNRWLRGIFVRAVVSHVAHAPDSWLSQSKRWPMDGP